MQPESKRSQLRGTGPHKQNPRARSNKKVHTILCCLLITFKKKLTGKPTRNGHPYSYLLYYSPFNIQFYRCHRWQSDIAHLRHSSILGSRGKVILMYTRDTCQMLRKASETRSQGRYYLTDQGIWDRTVRYLFFIIVQLIRKWYYLHSNSLIKLSTIVYFVVENTSGTGIFSYMFGGSSWKKIPFLEWYQEVKKNQWNILGFILIFFCAWNKNNFCGDVIEKENSFGEVKMCIYKDFRQYLWNLLIRQVNHAIPTVVQKASTLRNIANNT